MDTIAVAEIVTLGDIATACGVGAPAVSNWRARHDDFPEPFTFVGNGTTPLFVRSEIMAWNEWRKERKITRWRERLAEAQAQEARLRDEIEEQRRQLEELRNDRSV